ncbi:Fanconi anemia group A protein homolog [Mya arenaria]|uniref:Fanconi anemia group A protein homolog n=1 Tax=Mya arenaria TaxID=6604 RepID=UPI0022E00F3B|nr:Fanconi anemia group A protein homolog [Mya arenaria]
MAHKCQNLRSEPPKAVGMSVAKKNEELLRETVLDLLSHKQNTHTIMEELSELTANNSKLHSTLLGVGSVVMETMVGSRTHAGFQGTESYISRFLDAFQIPDKQEQNKQVQSVVCLMKALTDDGSTRARLHDSLCKKSDLPLNGIWVLHRDGVLPFTMYFTGLVNSCKPLEDFVNQMITSCRLSDDVETVKGLMSELVWLGYGDGEMLDPTVGGQATHTLAAIITGLVDAVITGETADIICVLDPGTADTTAMRKCCTSLLPHILSHNPVLKVSQAIRQQSAWVFGNVPRSLTSLYKQLLLPLSMDEVLTVLRHVLDLQEVNWLLLLSLVSVTIVCLPHADKHFLDFTDGLLQEGLESCDMESTVTGLLLARQACLQGPHVYMSYPDWFQKTFSDGGTSPASTRRSFTFFIKFLSDLMPYETAQHIKVHILRPPFVPSKCRQLLADYILLAKTRLEDLKETLDSIEDQTDPDKSGKTSVSVEVDSAVSVYAGTGRIPSSVLEASIFRKPHYVGHFLPLLLTPRPLPDFPDAKMKLIAALKSADKIPPSMYTTYETACKNEATQLLQGVFMDLDSDDDMELSPLEHLQSSLQHLITGKEKTAKHTEMELVSCVCERVEGVLSLTPQQTLDLPLCITLNIHDSMMDIGVLKVVDMILNAVCEGLHSHLETPTPCPQWLSRLLIGLGQYPVVMETLFLRIWSLVFKQHRALNEQHLSALAAILVEILLLGKKLPWIQNETIQCFPVVVMDSLTMKTEEEMRFCLQLTTLFLRYLALRLTDLEVLDGCPVVVKKFIYLATRLTPELRYHDMDMLVVMGTSSCVKAIFTSDVFQKILQKHMLTVGDWCQFESSVSPPHDLLSNIDRHEYIRWMVYHYFMAREEQSPLPPSIRHVTSEILHEVCELTMRAPNGVRGCENCADRTYGNNSLHVLTSLLQELTWAISTSPTPQLPWLQEQLNRLLIGCTDDTGKQTVVSAFFRLCVCLPPHLLWSDVPHVVTSADHPGVTSAVDTINNLLVKILSTGMVFPAGLTTHIIQSVRMCSSAGCGGRMLDELCLRCPVLHVSILVNNLCVWPLLNVPEFQGCATIGFLSKERCGDINSVDDHWLCAVGLFSCVMNSSEREVKQAIKSLGEKEQVLELALEIVVLQLSYELYLGEPKRPIVIKHLEASLQPLLSQSGQEGVAHLLSGGVDERSAACCAHPGSLTHKLTVLRCVSRNMEVVSPVIADSMDLLSSLLLLYSKVVEAYDGGDTDHDLVAEAIDGGGNVYDQEMLQVSSFIQGLISTFSVATLQHLDQDLVLSCGPAITETFINRLAT